MQLKKTQRSIFLLFLIFMLLFSSVACFAVDRLLLTIRSVVEKENRESQVNPAEKADSGSVSSPTSPITELTMPMPSALDKGSGMVYFISTYEPVQVVIEWSDLIPDCIRYQANATDGVYFDFEYNLDAGTFTGNAEGTAYGEEYQIWETWANFDVSEIEGTITRADNGLDYTFSGTGYLSIVAKEEAKCGYQLGDSTVTEMEGSMTVSPVIINGKIRRTGNSWQWSPMMTYSKDTFNFSLLCINCVVE